MVQTVPHRIHGMHDDGSADSHVGFLAVHSSVSGEKIAQVPIAGEAQCYQAVQAAQQAFLLWSAVPPVKRAHILFKFRELLEKHQAELAAMVTREHGKTLDDAVGSILRAIEVVEVHCGVLKELQGSFSANVATAIDCWTTPGAFGRVCRYLAV